MIIDFRLMKAYLLLLCLILLAFAQTGVEIDSNDDDVPVPSPQKVSTSSLRHITKKIFPSQRSGEVRSMRKIYLRLLRK